MTPRPDAGAGAATSCPGIGRCGAAQLCAARSSPAHSGVRAGRTGWRRALGRIAFRIALGAAALLAVAVPSASADFLDAYKAGLDAVERGDWPQAAKWFEQAAAERPEASPRLVGRLYFKPYLPHYYLGVVRSELGDCPGALAAFAESERQGVVGGRDEAADLAARRERCQGRMEAVEEAARRADAALASAEAAAGRVAELAADPALAGDWDRGEPSPAVEQAAALALLERARQRRVEGGEGADAGALGDAAELAGQAGRRLEALATAGEDRHRELALLDRQASARLDRLRGEGRAALDDTAELAASLRADPASPQPELLRRRRALEGLLAEVPAEAAGAEAAADRLASALAALRQAATPPAAALSAAAEAYFAGDYQGAADRLDALLGGLGGGAATARTRAHALLLRSAARFALAAGGERAPELLDAARADAAACRRADPDLVPPERLFSPRFRELFEAAGEGGG